MLFFQSRNLLLFILFYNYNLYYRLILENKNLENERLDRMEQHLRLMKDTITDISHNSKRISDSLIGNEYTAGVGIVHNMSKIDDELDKVKNRVDRLDENMNFAKWLGSGVGALVLAMIIWILQKQFDK